MINIIKTILEENKYQLVEKADCKFYFFKNNSENKEDYYLIVSAQ